MRRILVALFLFTASCAAAEPQVDVDEVIRRGDSVTHTGDGFQAGEEEAIGASLALPPDDSHKWFIVIFTQRGCQPCEQLKRDWSRSGHLQAWARPDDPKSSWAHFSEVRADDGSQKWRLRNYKVTSFPTIVLQPPRTGEYGDPSTVVFQKSGYDGKPDSLADALSRSLKTYVAKAHRANQLQLAGGYRQNAPAESYEPPFSPPPRLDQPFPFYPAGPGIVPMGPALQIPPGPMPATPEQLRAACPGADGEFILAQLTANATVEQAQVAWRTEQTRREMLKIKDELEKAKEKPQPAQPTQPNPVSPAPRSPMSNLATVLLTLGGAGGFFGVIAMVLMLYRSYRKATGKSTLLTDEQFNALVKTMQGTSPNANPNAPSAR